MKKSIFLAAVAALVLAGCAKNETFVKVTDDDAVSFGAYSGRTITKAGPTDDMNLDALKKHGFGVFATYSGTNDFSEATDDFMYNQQVTYNTTDNVWTYTPVKYWPNPTNGQNADAQKVSFFAYAPYANPGTTENYGVTGFHIDTVDGSATKGHNFVEYTFSKDKPNVDLMWGYNEKVVDNSNPSNPVVTYKIDTNLTRTTDKVYFKFQHLLAKLGGSQEGNSATLDPYSDAYVANGLVVKANAETIKPTSGFGKNDGTKITISKIVIASAPETEGNPAVAVTDVEGKKITYTKKDITGNLDLYTGKFTADSTALIQFSQTITNNPAEISANPATADSEIADCLKEPVGGISTWDSLSVKGVVEKAINVYKDESNPIILIPGTKPVVDITLTYYVRTYDEKLGTKKCSEVPQTAFGRIKFAEIKKNTKYNIVMIIGLNDVKFEAQVEDWTTGVNQEWIDADNDGVVDEGEMHDIGDTEIGLPYNLQ